MGTKLPTVIEPTRLEGAPKKDMEEYVGSDDTESTSKHVPVKGDGPLEATLELSPNDEFDPDRSAMSVTTPRRIHEGGMSDSLFNDLPPGDQSTPRTVEPASPLSRPATRQATVEDYEDTLLAPAAPSETEKALGMALNQLREELASVRAQMRDSESSHETKLALLQSQAGETNLKQAQQLDQKEARIRSLEARVEDQDEKLEEAKREIVTLGRELESMEEKYRVAHEDLQEERAENDLHSQRMQSNCDKLAADKRDANTRVAMLEAELAQVRKEGLVLQENHDNIQANAVELQETVRVLETQIERLAARDQVQELQRLRNPNISDSGSEKTVTPDNEDLKSETQRLRDELGTEHALELSVLKAEAEAHAKTCKYLELELVSFRVSNATLRATVTEKDMELQQLKERLQEHLQEISVMEAEAEETATNARESYSRNKEHLEHKLETMKEENATLRVEAVELGKEVESLRSKLQDQTQSSAQIDMLTKERDLLISKFKEQKRTNAKSRSESQDTISTLQAQVKDLTSINATLTKDLQNITKDLSKTRQLAKIAEFETNAALREREKVSLELEMMKEKTEAINAQFDKRMTEYIKEREMEWRRKYEALKKERGVMGRVLMKEWGEKELGVMEPKQGYRYKYV